jgi:F1F0 ATPase subunit 2
MGELTHIIVALLAGFGLGVLFFGGLWLTVRALPRSRYPAALMLGSFWGRTALVVAGFTLAIARRWQNALVFLLGFLIARLLLARWIPGRKAMKGSAV